MAETTMPAAEAAVAVADERNSYELAFHILPTVAEGEVPGVFEEIKALITKHEGEIFEAEAPERFDLAYEIIKHTEGKNRKYASAYFGWVRFKAEPSIVAPLTEEMESRTDILRDMLIKLSKAEEAHSFRFHEALASQRMVTTVEESAVVPDITTVDHSEEISNDEVETEEAGEVDEQEIEEALKKEEV